MPGTIQPSIEGAVKAALDNTPLTSPQPEITRAIIAAMDGGGGGGVSGVSSVNGFSGAVTIGTSSATNIKVQDFFSPSDFAVGTSGKIESIGGASGGPIARRPELFKYGGDAEAGYTQISTNVITVSNSILFIDYILILNGSTGLYYLQDNGSDYSVGTNTVTINNPVLTDGMKIKIAYYS